MKINDFTDPNSTRLPLILPVKLIVIHHCSLAGRGLDVPNPIADAGLTGANLSAMFELRRGPEPVGLGTAGCRPYHALIRQDGQIDQCLSLGRRGAHALAYNCNTLAVATAGENGLTSAQRVALVEVLADWLFYAEGAPVFGHSSLLDGTTPGHPICPHPTTNVSALTAEALALQTKSVCAANPEQRNQALRARGWVI